MRDTFGYMEDEHTLTGYIARQSLISAASAPTALGGPLVTKGFEARAVQGDLNSSLYGVLREAANRTDILVMDLLVERFGVLKLPDGSYVTRTPNMRLSETLGEMWETAEYIELGTDAHFALWTAAVDKLVPVLEETGLLPRTLMFETAWAEMTDEGEPVRRYSGWSAERAAGMFARYYAHMRALGIRSVRLPDELVLSTESHQWGPSPYHYVAPAYEWMRGQIVHALPENA